MKRLILSILIVAALALSLGHEGPAEAESYGRWRYQIVADSIDAETSDTFYVDVGFCDAFQAIGFYRNAMTGTPDGVYAFAIPINEPEGTALWAAIWVQKQGTAVAATLAGANTQFFFMLAPFSMGNYDHGPQQQGIPGNTLRIIYAKGTVTGGNTSLYLWTRPILTD